MSSKTNEPIVLLDQRLGSASKFGIAYLVTGTKLARLLKFACKIMSIDEYGHEDEVKLLHHLDKLVVNKTCPHFPMTYNIVKCMSKCEFPSCDAVTKEGRYYVVMNELADTDLVGFFKAKSHDRSVYESVMMQIIFALYIFHGTGYIHGDCHMGNFLIHEIEPGGFWRYQVDEQIVHVKKCGYLVVLWDYGMCEKTKETNKDYSHALMPFSLHMKRAMTQFNKSGFYLPPEDFRKTFAKPLYNILSKTEDMKAVLQVCKKYGENMIVDDFPNEHVLNIKPYVRI